MPVLLNSNFSFCFIRFLYFLLWFSIACSFLLKDPEASAQENINKRPFINILKEIQTETVKYNDNRNRPLPVAAHWHSGESPERLGTPYQLELIKRGHHVLPSVDFPNPTINKKIIGKKIDFYRKTIDQIARWKLPFTLKCTQWEQELYRNDIFFNLPHEHNPNVITTEGELIKMLSPFGAVEPWRKVGAYWGGSPLMLELQTLYPEPPRIFLLSNNESKKLRWAKQNGSLNLSKRFNDRFGEGRDDEWKRRIVGEGWIERYRAMQAGMRASFNSFSWRENARFIGYDAFGPPHFGRLGLDSWKIHSLVTSDRIDPAPLMWDGGSPSYYVHHWNPSTDYHIWSPQIEAMNWVFMCEETLRDNPDFWFEISVWDGSFGDHRTYQKVKEKDQVLRYRKAGQKYSPARYAGFVQFGMWLLTPRAVREWRPSLDTRERVAEYFEALVAAVDRVYTEPNLTRFWREGQLVPNRSHKHPYQTNIPEQYKDVDRWFLLDTSLNPDRPWALSTEIPVFSLARVLGEPGQREWLVYTYSPLKNRKEVELQIPEFGDITVNVTVGGSFYIVKEKDCSTTPIASDQKAH